MGLPGSGQLDNIQCFPEDFVRIWLESYMERHVSISWKHTFVSKIWHKAISRNQCSSFDIYFAKAMAQNNVRDLLCYYDKCKNIFGSL